MTKYHNINPIISGVGMALPDNEMSNNALIEREKMFSNDEWIREHTGIEKRFFAGNNVFTSDLAIVAAKMALAQSGIGIQKLSAIYLGTITPDYPSPSTASLVHKAINAPEEDCTALDISGACAGGIASLELAVMKVQNNPNQAALAIGAETLSNRTNFNDRSTAILFGDGAGAVVVENKPDSHQPVFSSMVRSDPASISIPAGGIREVPNGFSYPRGKIHMNGPAVKKAAIEIMCKTAISVAKKADIYNPRYGINWQEVDYFIPHQSNLRISDALGKELQVPKNKQINTVIKHGNTSAASAFLALAQTQIDKQLRPRTYRLFFTSVGIGFVGTAALIDFQLT
jgi:3-oxoacyl-[acyl-carrier-protein] synthase-3